MPLPHIFTRHSALCRTALLLPAVLLVSGCFSSVDCNSSSVKKDVLTIIDQQLDKAAWYHEMKLALNDDATLSNVITLKQSESPKAATCQANYAFTYNGKPRTLKLSYETRHLEDIGEAQVAVDSSDLSAQMMALAIVEQPVKNGEQIVSDPATGRVLQKLHWKHNKLDGMQEFYSAKTGALVVQFNAVNGQKDGPQKGWSDDGKTLLVDLNWVDSKATGYEKRFVSGKLVTDLQWQGGRQTGVLSDQSDRRYGRYTEMPYKDGQKHGIAKIYGYARDGDERAVLTRTETYVNGQQHGVTKTYYSDGALSGESTYTNGKLEGMVKSYHENGKLSREEPYRADVRHGTQKDYDGQGRLVQTSTWEEGRRRGLAVEYGPDGTPTRQYNLDGYGGFDEIQATPAPSAQTATTTQAAISHPSSILPSFDCKLAKSKMELLICSDTRLAQADVILAASYKAALSSSPSKGALKDEQRQWLKSASASCGDADCLLKAYNQRIAQLSGGK